MKLIISQAGGGSTVVRVALIALAVRLAAAGAFGTGDPGGDFPDAERYLAMAGNIAEGRGWEVGPGARAERPPLYPALLALHLRLFGAAEAAVLAQALLGAAACAAAAWTARRLWGPRAGLVAGLATAADPFLVFASTRFLSESVYVPLVVFQTLAAVEWGRAAFARERGRALGWAAAAGAFGGLGALAHAGHLLFPVVLLAAFGLAWRRARQFEKPDGLLLPAAGAAALLLAHIAVIAPWTLRNAAVFDAIVPVTTKLGPDLYEATFPGATGGPAEWWAHPAGRAAWDRTVRLPELKRDRALRAEAWRHVREDPWRMARLAVAKAWRVWTPVPSYGRFRDSWMGAAAAAWYGVVVVFALTGLRRLKDGSVLAALLPAVPVYLTLVHCVFIGSMRYRMPMEPALVMLAAWGASRQSPVPSPQ